MQDREIIARMMLLNLLRCRRLRERTAGSGLYDGQLPILECLIDCPGSTQIQLAERLAVTPASIAQSTKRLQRAGLIEKRVDENNLRCNRLYATESGASVAKAYRQEFDQLDAETLAGLSYDDRKTLSELLERMGANLNYEKLDYLPPWKETHA